MASSAIKKVIAAQTGINRGKVTEAARRSQRGDAYAAFSDPKFGNHKMSRQLYNEKRRVSNGGYGG